MLSSPGNEPISRHELRELLQQLIKTDSELIGFCQSHFPAVHQEFGDSMYRTVKVNLLLMHIEPAILLQTMTDVYGAARVERERARLQRPVSPTSDPETAMLRTQLSQLQAERQALLAIGQSTVAHSQRIKELKRSLSQRHAELGQGDILGNKYRLEELIGSGAIAKIWRAYNQKTEQDVAVKVLRSEHTDNKPLIERFFRGAEKIEGLQHPYLVRVLDSPKAENGYYFYVMEYLSGGNLEDALAHKTISRDQAIRAVLQTGAALVFAHHHLLRHRDVQPRNILLDRLGWARLSDFDLVLKEGSTGGTVSNTALGSPLYAAPEQQADARDVDGRADVYSLAITMMCAFAGRPRNQLDIINPDLLISESPAVIRDLLSEATALQRDERPESLELFCAEIEQRLISAGLYKFEATHPTPEILNRKDPHLERSYGKYRVLRKIGTGGMGAVYEAEDTQLKRRVAVKFLPDSRSKQDISIARFISEAQVASRLNHPNIIGIYDIGYENGSHYIAMELLNPGSAGYDIKYRGRMNWVEACDVIAHCCSGLSAAHQAGLIHRDIKPDNILVSPAGQVKLADFGLVKELLEETSLTKSGVVVGTPRYMSPEQASGQPLDRRTDIYSLGASLYALLTGVPPYPTGSLPQIMMAHIQAPVPDPRRLAPDVPEAVARIVCNSMAKRPAERYQDAEEMRLALTEAGAGVPRPSFRFLVVGKRPSLPRTPAIPRKSVPTLPGQAIDTTPQPAPLVHRGHSPSPIPSTTRPDAPTQETSRRMWLIGGAGLLLAGAGLASRFGSRPEGEVGPAIPGGVEPERQATPHRIAMGREPIRVGVINSQAGTLSISARPVIDATLLAINELNERGGILGSRQIEAIVADGKSDNAIFAREAEKLIVEKKVVTLFGGWSSSNRHSMRPIVERTGNLLMFPARNEGLEDSPNVIYCGPVPNQLVVPALRWCLANRKVERIFYMGTDEMFSHTAAEIIRDALAAMAANGLGREGGHDKDRPRIVGESFALLGQKNFANEIKRLVAARPDLIFNSLIGSSNIDFLAELRAAGIGPKQAPMVSFTMGENELAQIADIDVNGDYVAASYLQALSREQNVRFIDRFRKMYGDYRVVSAPMEAAYSSVFLWAQAVEQAGSTEVPAIRNALRNQSFDGPGGTVRVDPSNQHTWRPFRMGQISPEGIKIVGGDDTLIPPAPFPASRTRTEWEAFARDLFRRWGGNWVNPDRPNPLR